MIVLLVEELEIILWAARRETGSGEELAPVAARVRDWRAVAECASRSGVVPLVARALGGQAAAPFAIRRDLHRQFTVNAGRNALMARELSRILLDFREQGIEALAYKGAALAMMAYGNLALRNPSSDIDLLLKASDIFRAKELIRRRGYRLILSPEQERHFLKHRYHLHFERTDPEIHVELHWAITPAYWPFPLDYWSRTQQIALGGAEVRTLDPECTLLALCAHGCKEAWPRLSQIRDVSRLIQAHPALDWDWVMAEARRLKRERILRLGLALAARFTQVPLPPPVARFAAADPVVCQLVHELGDRLGMEEALRGVGFYRYALRVWSCPKDRFRYLLYILRMLPKRFRTLAAVGAEDRKLVDLPGGLSFLYLFIRPLRAVFQRGISRALWTFRRGI